METRSSGPATRSCQAAGSCLWHLYKIRAASGTSCSSMSASLCRPFLRCTYLSHPSRQRRQSSVTSWGSCRSGSERTTDSPSWRGLRVRQCLLSSWTCPLFTCFLASMRSNPTLTTSLPLHEVGSVEGAAYIAASILLTPMLPRCSVSSTSSLSIGGITTLLTKFKIVDSLEMRTTLPSAAYLAPLWKKPLMLRGQFSISSRAPDSSVSVPSLLGLWLTPCQFP